MRSINLKEHEVRGILDGKVSLIVRPIKPQPPEWVTEMGYTAFTPKRSISGRGEFNGDGAECFIKCPLGAPGDTLIGKETFYCDHYQYTPKPEMGQINELLDCMYYRATDCDALGHCYTGFSGETMAVPWRPSIHMPQWASRIRLEVVNVRAVRLSGFSIGDVFKTGAPFEQEEGWATNPDGTLSVPQCGKDACKWFRETWDKYYGKQFPVESSPWAWAVEVKEAQT